VNEEFELTELNNYIRNREMESFRPDFGAGGVFDEFINLRRGSGSSDEHMLY
jgi:hypothetical protein